MPLLRHCLSPALCTAMHVCLRRVQALGRSTAGTNVRMQSKGLVSQGLFACVIEQFNTDRPTTGYKRSASLLAEAVQHLRLCRVFCCSRLHFISPAANCLLVSTRSTLTVRVRQHRPALRTLYWLTRETR